MLDPEVVVNLLPEVGVVMGLVRHGNWPGERFKCGAVPSTSFGATCPSERIPKSGMQALAVCTTPGQLECSVALALQQYGQQSALRKSLG